MSLPFKKFVYLALHPFQGCKKIMENPSYLPSLAEMILCTFICQFIIYLFFILIIPWKDSTLSLGTINLAWVQLFYGTNNAFALNYPSSGGIVAGLLLWLLIYPFYKLFIYYLHAYIINIFTAPDRQNMDGKIIARMLISADLFILFPLGGIYLSILAMIIQLFAALRLLVSSKLIRLLITLNVLVSVFLITYLLAMGIGIFTQIT